MGPVLRAATRVSMTGLGSTQLANLHPGWFLLKQVNKLKYKTIHGSSLRCGPEIILEGVDTKGPNQNGWKSNLPLGVSRVVFKIKENNEE